MGGDDNIATSPFTLVFKIFGLAFAASFMNAVILTSVLSEVIQVCMHQHECYIL